MSILQNIFLVCYGAGHINIIEPIVDQLLKNKNYNVKLLALTTAHLKVKNKYDKNILKSISDYLFLFDENINNIFQNGLEIFEENYNDSIGLSKLEVLSYLGLSYSESIEKLGITKAYEEYQKIGRRSFLPIDTIKKILKYENIDLVITTTSPRFEKASLIAAKELCVKSIQIDDLFGEDILEQLGTYTIVMNESVKKDLMKKGFDEKSLFVFGQLAIENSVNNVLNLDKKIICEKLSVNIDKKKQNLVYFSQRPIKFDKSGKFSGFTSYDEMNGAVFQILKNLTNKFNIFMRLHPNENINDYIKYFEKYYEVKYLNDKLSLAETVALSDIVVTPNSTVSIEALICNKKVFTFKPDFDSFFPSEYLKNKPFIYSDSFKELESNLIDDKYNEDNTNFFKFGFLEKFQYFLHKNVFKDLLCLK